MRFSFSPVIYAFLGILLFSSTAIAEAIPPVVKKYFEAYLTLHPNEKRRSMAKTLERQYAYYFLTGLTSPTETWSSGGIETDAYNQGQSYWKDHPNEREKILASYGYVPVDAKGIWRCGFERDSFSPIGRKSEEWWISSFRGASRGNEFDLNCDKMHFVRITGYVSPIGNYGHLGSYKREIFFTSFTISNR